MVNGASDLKKSKKNKGSTNRMEESNLKYLVLVICLIREGGGVGWKSYQWPCTKWKRERKEEKEFTQIYSVHVNTIHFGISIGGRNNPGMERNMG